MKTALHPCKSRLWGGSIFLKTTFRMEKYADNNAKELNGFLDYLFAKKAQTTIPREERIKAVFRWRYMHSAESLSSSEILS
jgi:hypothetical protein